MPGRNDAIVARLKQVADKGDAASDFDLAALAAVLQRVVFERTRKLPLCGEAHILDAYEKAVVVGNERLEAWRRQSGVAEQRGKALYGILRSAEAFLAATDVGWGADEAVTGLRDAVASFRKL